MDFHCLPVIPTGMPQTIFQGGSRQAQGKWILLNYNDCLWGRKYLEHWERNLGLLLFQSNTVLSTFARHSVRTMHTYVRIIDIKIEELHDGWWFPPVWMFLQWEYLLAFNRRVPTSPGQFEQEWTTLDSSPEGYTCQLKTLISEIPSVRLWTGVRLPQSLCKKHPQTPRFQHPLASSNSSMLTITIRRTSSIRGLDICFLFVFLHVSSLLWRSFASWRPCWLCLFGPPRSCPDLNTLRWEEGLRPTQISWWFGFQRGRC